MVRYTPFRVGGRGWLAALVLPHSQSNDSSSLHWKKIALCHTYRVLFSVENCLHEYYFHSFLKIDDENTLVYRRGEGKKSKVIYLYPCSLAYFHLLSWRPQCLTPPRNSYLRCYMISCRLSHLFQVCTDKCQIGRESNVDRQSFFFFKCYVKL